jgi:hypothetical protein
MDYFRPAPDADQARQLRLLDEFITLAREDGPRLVQQCILGEVQKNYGGDLGSYLLLVQAGITEGDYAVALSTLFYCDDATVRGQARKLFPRITGCGCVDGYPDLSHVRDHITGGYQKSAVATPLKRALFEALPSASFFLFSGAYFTAEIERDEIIPYRRKQRLVDNALYEKKWLGGIPGGKVDEVTTRALRELAASKYWWSRMFVAELMVQHKEFRDADTIKKLRDDENELVRNSIASIETPDPLRATPVDQ